MLKNNTNTMNPKCKVGYKKKKYLGKFEHILTFRINTSTGKSFKIKSNKRKKNLYHLYLGHANVLSLMLLYKQIYFVLLTLFLQMTISKAMPE